MRHPIVYVACPYSHPDPAVLEERFQAANRAAAKLIDEGNVVFSPISMSHPIAEIAGNHLSPAWYDFDDAFIPHCTSIVVLTVDGWDRSRGVAHEIALFAERGIAPTFMEPVR